MKNIKMPYPRVNSGQKDRLGKSLLTRKYVCRIGESAAAEYLKSKGHIILGRNIRFKRGEVDIVSRLNDMLHVVEVKAILFRSRGKIGNLEDEMVIPEDHFSREKMQKLKYLANRIFIKYKEELEVQIDGIAIRIYVSPVAGASAGSLKIERITARYYPALS